MSDTGWDSHTGMSLLLFISQLYRVGDRSRVSNSKFPVAARHDVNHSRELLTVSYRGNNTPVALSLRRIDHPPFEPLRPPVHIEFQNCSVHIVTITTRHRFHPVSPGCRFSFPSRRTAHRCAITFITLRCSSRGGYDMDRDRYLPSNNRALLLISSFVNLHRARALNLRHYHLYATLFLLNCSNYKINSL